MGLLDKIKSALGGGRVDVSKRFTLLRESISGTMSKFYVARDLQKNKVVGLKILDREKTAAFEDRFRGLNKPSEGAIGMPLKHPRLIETFEYGITTEGSPYIIFEFIDGPDFNSLIIAKDPILEGNCLHFIRQAGEGLAAFHAAGFTHRDVSPRNLLLSNRENRELKLIDFGLSVPSLPQFQQPGIRTGNPNYMAPEIVRRRTTDQKVDVFAYGVSAYEICTGHLPWPRGNTGQVAMAHDSPPVNILTLRAKLNPILAKTIHWCLEPDPTKRCPTVEKFLQTIRPALKDDA